ncbi:prefoldin subunit 6-like [Sycon ciliatum]|uniref:prefoldin subunit 6-like n=1 Tax=Sycon ciliatum TaxID=27933 RepID=UPI0031F65EF5
MAAAIKELQAMERHLQELGEKFQEKQKDLQKSARAREHLETQRQENVMVKEELDLLAEEANVFKMVGPVLVKQDLGEARMTVDKRLEYINKEIARYEKLLADGQGETTKVRDNIQKVQGKYKQLQMALMQQQQPR